MEINCQKATGTMYNTVNVSSIFRGICLRSNAKSASSRHTATSFAILSNLSCLDGHHKTSVKSEEVDKTREVQCTSYKCVPWWKCQRKYSLFCFRSRNPSAASISIPANSARCVLPMLLHDATLILEWISNYNLGVRPRLPSIFAKINAARRAAAEFEQNKGVRAEFWADKRFLRALPAGRISHFTSRIYPSLGLSTSCSRFSKKFPVISQKVAQKLL